MEAPGHLKTQCISLPWFLKLAPAREYKFKLSPPSFFTSQHMLKISPGKDIANMSCLLPGLLCLKWDDEGPMSSLLCLYRKIYYHYIIPDHLRPQYETSMVMRFSPASIYKPSLSSTRLRSSHHTFKIFTQKSHHSPYVCSPGLPFSKVLNAGRLF
jgi:hypothetical protein